MKVGDSAQMTANVGVEVTPIENFNIDINWRYVNDLYAKIDVSTLGSRTNNTNENSIKLPEYNLFDVGASYKYKFPKGRHSITVLANVNNVLDTTYIAESDTNIHTTNSSVTYKGIDVRNKVFFGFGRTWNIGLKYHF